MQYKLIYMGIIQRSSERISYLAATIPPLLRNISEEHFSLKPSPEKWSRKQIIGHLIDSAANNHHRFIRSRTEDGPHISYNQDEWNNLSRYNEMSGEDIVTLWAHYNKLLSHIISNMTEQDLQRKCYIGNAEPLTLGFVVDDYVRHLEHHLKQVVEYY